MESAQIALAKISLLRFTWEILDRVAKKRKCRRCLNIPGLFNAYSTSLVAKVKDSINLASVIVTDQDGAIDIIFDINGTTKIGLIDLVQPTRDKGLVVELGFSISPRGRSHKRHAVAALF